MKYILVLGILYKKFKEEKANVRLYVGNRLVDDFNIEQDLPHTDGMLQNIQDTHYKTFDMTRVLTDQKDTKDWTEMPKFHKVFEIDGTHLNGSVKIQVNNSWSDYTNGFMKNSAMIQFPVIAMFPKQMIENNGEKLMENICRFDKFRQKNRSKSKDKKYTRLGFTWPLIEQLNIDFEFDQHNESGLYFNNHWLGSNFDINIDVITKHGIKMLHTAGTERTGLWNGNFVKSALLGSCKQLLNIYNEDQRSNIT